MHKSYETVPVGSIDPAYQRYRLGQPSFDVENLKDAINRSGLIHPVVVKPVPEGKYGLVVGFRRYDAVKKLGHSHIDAIILGPDEEWDEKKFDLECLKFAITERSCQRPLDVFELLCAIERLKDHLDVQEIVAISPAVFNQVLNPSIVRQYIRMAGLSENLRVLMSTGRLSVKPALMLSDIPTEQADVFGAVFSKISLSSSNQKDVIQLSLEISSRDKKPVKQIFSNDPFLQILKDDHLDPRAKGKKIKEMIAELRFPHLTQARNTFTKTCRSLGLSGRIQLTPPKNFEGLDYSLSFQFQSLSEFESCLKKLDQLSGDEQFRRLFP
ncbi:MAG: hypothetical protein D3926_04710 [Desulfobacteraceae bacterium]|nr:MAG: hypothetical protein D3926_04710 [Desulfobacteraceae bacterium]